MTAFSIVLFGQMISILGSSMTSFALSIWAWQTTGEVTALALVTFFRMVPRILFTPFAGALVDRWNKKLVMMFSDLAAGLASIMVLILFAAGQLQIWHLYVTAVITGLFGSFQWPAYSAAISVMIPKEQYMRAAGMQSIADYGPGLLAPALAGLLLGITTLAGILVIDIATFVFAIVALLLVNVPATPPTGESRRSLWQDALFGFQYIIARPGLLGLQLVFLTGNFLAVGSGLVVTPLILARTQENSQILGLVKSVIAAGAIIGGLLVIAWGGPKKKVRGVLLGWFLGGLLGVALFGVNGGLVVWLAAGFCGGFLPQFIDSANQSIWQAKVPPGLQGRVFSARSVIAQISSPLAALLIGPLADRIFEPAMQSQAGPLPLLFSWITGREPGSGMMVVCLLAGLGISAISLVAFANPAVRNVETLLPDHDEIGESIV